MSKELNSQMETKEQDFQRQFQEFIGKHNPQFLGRFIPVFPLDKSYQNENDLQQKLHAAEERLNVCLPMNDPVKTFIFVFQNEQPNADDVIEELQIETLNHREVPRVQ
jgi:hypothetical protein